MLRKSGHLYEFGPFVLDTVQQLLTRDGAPVQLTPKTYDTLLVLVENHGCLLSKADLMKAVWPDSFVEDSNLTQQISMIRRADTLPGKFVNTAMVRSPSRVFSYSRSSMRRSERTSPLSGSVTVTFCS